METEREKMSEKEVANTYKDNASELNSVLIFYFFYLTFI